MRSEHRLVCAQFVCEVIKIHTALRFSAAARLERRDVYPREAGVSVTGVTMLRGGGCLEFVDWGARERLNSNRRGAGPVGSRPATALPILFYPGSSSTLGRAPLRSLAFAGSRPLARFLAFVIRFRLALQHPGRLLALSPRPHVQQVDASPPARPTVRRIITHPWKKARFASS